MKKVVCGAILAYLAFLRVLIIPMIFYVPTEEKLKIEPIEREIKAEKTIGADEIMNSLIKASTDTRKEENGITYKEAQMLMKIATAEAEGEGIEGQAMVMAVVLNRVKDKRFPDSIEAVIFQEGQFSPVTDGRYYTVKPGIESHLALTEIEKGNYNNVDALYFENAEESWQQKNCIYLYTVGHHRFYRN